MAAGTHLRRLLWKTTTSKCSLRRREISRYIHGYMAAAVAHSFNTMNVSKSLSTIGFSAGVDIEATPSDLRQVQNNSSPAVEKNTDPVSWMSDYVPVFAIDGSKVKVIHEPTEFYESLKEGVLSAKKRIVLASLYLGTGKLEQEFVDCIHIALSKAKLSAGESLQVDILLDYTRGCRGSENSCTMLLPLLSDFPDNVRVALYHTPDLRGFLKKIVPERYNETVGLSHMKAYIFDDSVIMSGANLSENYFTNRQDRYIVLRDCPELADFYTQLVCAVSSFSLQLNKDQTFSLSPDFNIHPYLDNDNGQRFKEEAQKRVLEVIKPYTKNSCTKDNHHDRPVTPSPVHKDSTHEKEHPFVDTWVYPLTQMGPLNINIDDEITQRFFREVGSNFVVFLASGYFNLTDRYMDVIVSESKANFEILSASPQVNGFYGAAGFAGLIPDAYTCISKMFTEKVCNSGQKDRINLYEFTRKKWTFHAKGVWLYLPNENLPVVTFIGSPNFGYRSVYRDLENQIVIATRNPHLQEQLHQEQERLFSRSYKVDESIFEQPDRKAPLWVRLVTGFIRRFF